MTRTLDGVQACVFDAYGTLFDFASAAARCPGVPEDRRQALTALWRDRQCQYTWLHTLEDRYADFWQVTGDALDFALESLDLESPRLRERLMDLYLGLEPFPEVPAVLASLREAGFRIAVLSNGSPMMLDALVKRSGLETMFDAVLSADAVRAFKTHPDVYQYALRSLDLEASAISFQSSNAWDAHGASDFGMLDDLFGSRDPIPFELKNSQRFNRYVYLRPEPSEPFITLTNEVLTAYPDLKPYGGRFGYDGVIPHLTVAYHHNDAVLNQISVQLEGTRIVTVASVVHLMECRNDGWCSIAEFRLGK